MNKKSTADKVKIDKKSVTKCLWDAEFHLLNKSCWLIQQSVTSSSDQQLPDVCLTWNCMHAKGAKQCL